MKIVRLIYLLLLLTIMPAHASADEYIDVLLLNSFSNDSPWSRAVITPINRFMFRNDSVRCIEENLNCIFIDSIDTYNMRVNRVFEKYHDLKPKAVILVGGFALTMRDMIKEKWGDVPMMLINRSNRYAPLNYYFSGFYGPSDWDNMPKISDIQNKYNLTLIEIPDQYAQTIKLMTEMFPGMDKLTFMSDNIYFNRSLNKSIREFINREYPQLQYEWIQIDENTIEACEDKMLTFSPKTGILMSTWRYMVLNDYGTETLMAGEQSFLSGSNNPIFTLRQTYVPLGSIGGVYNDRVQVKDMIEQTLREIISGVQPRNIPFKYADKTEVILNYPLLDEYKIDVKSCPDNAIYIDKPSSIWDRYKWTIVLIVLVVSLVFFILMMYIFYQRRLVKSLNSHASLIKNLPIPYAKVLINYDSNGNIIGIHYKKRSINEHFKALVKATTANNSAEEMLPSSLLAEIAKQLETADHPISLTKNFERNNTSYLFSMCMSKRLVNSPTVSSFNRLLQNNISSVTEFDIFAYDVTNIRDVSQELSDTANTLDVTLQVANVMPWQWILEERAIQWNADYIDPIRQKIIGNDTFWQGQRTTEARLLEVVHPDDRDNLKAMFDGYHSGALTHHSMQMRITFTGDDGSKAEEWVEIKSMLGKVNGDDDTHTVFGSLLFITDRKNQENALIEANKRALESDRLKSEFLASMSHEIRTPLNAITGFARLLIDNPEPELKPQFYDIIENNCQMLINIVGDVLDLAKIESNSLDYSYHDFDLNILLHQIKDSIQRSVPEQIKLNLLIRQELCWINSDDVRLSQVLTNLLSNAIKFTNKGSISFGYDIADNNMLRFFVRDTGIGVNPMFHEVIFERFKKLDTFTQGTGIGLTVSKAVVRGMGGSIGVNSDGNGRGSEFWFTIPYTPAR